MYKSDNNYSDNDNINDNQNEKENTGFGLDVSSLVCTHRWCQLPKNLFQVPSFKFAFILCDF